MRCKSLAKYRVGNCIYYNPIFLWPWHSHMPCSELWISVVQSPDGIKCDYVFQLIDPGLISFNLGQKRICSLSRRHSLKPLSRVFYRVKYWVARKKDIKAKTLYWDMALFCWTFSRLDYTDKKTTTFFRQNRYGLKTDGRLRLTLNLLGRIMSSYG